MKKHKIILGSCAVDSGQLFIADPCYLRDWKDGEADDLTSHYGQSCEATLSKKGGGEVFVSGFGTGVAVGTGGDGVFPVEAELEDGRVKSITIIFY